MFSDLIVYANADISKEGELTRLLLQLRNYRYFLSTRFQDMLVNELELKLENYIENNSLTN